MSQLPPDTLALIDKARGLEKWSVARLISLVENETKAGIQKRRDLMEYLAANEHQGAFVAGITGTPGSGKSSLIAATCMSLLSTNKNLSIAVLAIDPSSQTSGGSILGDRTRMDLGSGDDRLFFRSQASALDLGGLGRKTFHVIRLLKYFFDLVIIETVGIGQSEIEVDRLSDHTCLVMQPLSGDQVQFIKAGIMEVPDTFIVNKCDEEALASKSYHMLRSSLKLTLKELNSGSHIEKKIFLTSVTNGRGIEDFSAHIMSQLTAGTKRRTDKELDDYFLAKWVKDQFGEFGVNESQQLQFSEDMSYESKELALSQHIKKKISEK